MERISHRSNKALLFFLSLFIVLLLSVLFSQTAWATQDDWQQEPADLNSGAVGLFTTDGTELYAASGQRVLQFDRSSKAWVDTGFPGSASGGISSIVVHKGTLYASWDNGGVYEYKGANTWIPLTGLPGTHFRQLVSDGTTLYAGTIDGVFVYNEATLSWTSISPDQESTLLYTDGTSLYAGFESDLLVYNGTSWSDLTQGVFSNPITSIVSVGTSLYVGVTYEGVFIYDGNTWTAVNTGLSDLVVESLVLHESTLYAGTYGSGVFAYDGDANQWTADNQGLGNMSVLTLFSSGRTLYAGTGSGAYSQLTYADVTSINASPAAFSLQGGSCTVNLVGTDLTDGMTIAVFSGQTRLTDAWASTSTIGTSTLQTANIDFPAHTSAASYTIMASYDGINWFPLTASVSLSDGPTPAEGGRLAATGDVNSSCLLGALALAFLAGAICAVARLKRSPLI